MQLEAISLGRQSYFRKSDKTDEMADDMREQGDKLREVGNIFENYYEENNDKDDIEAQLRDLEKVLGASAPINLPEAHVEPVQRQENIPVQPNPAIQNSINIVQMNYPDFKFDTVILGIFI